MGSASCHRRSPLTVALRQSFAPSFSRLHEPHAQRLVRTHNMIGGSPPFQVSYQVWRLLRCGPGTASQRGSSMSDGQWSPLNRGGGQPTKKGPFPLGGCESCLLSLTP